MNLIIVAGARPNFMKIAPIISAINLHNKINNHNFRHLLVHTGQHYDEKMSNYFFNDLGIPTPDINLGVGSSSHARQTAEIMKRFEKICLQEKPTHVLVVGDVNSTIACALVSSKLGIKVVHVEAGLRSFDRTMPEEINRVLTDAISDFLFTTEQSANENLKIEGIPQEKIHFVGNVMIDTLLKHREKAEKSNILTKLGLILNSTNSSNPINQTKRTTSVRPYAILTLHRPSNVDDREIFQGILDALSMIGKHLPIVFSVHPRTLNRIREFGFDKFFDWKLFNRPNLKKPSKPTNSTNSKNLMKPMSPVTIVSPLGYLDFLNLMANAELVLTDSGGIQEETTILGVSCVTLRKNTERPMTVEIGRNVIAGTEKQDIINSALSQLHKPNGPNKPNKSKMPPLWDGKAAERIINVLAKELTL